MTSQLPENKLNMHPAITRHAAHLTEMMSEKGGLTVPSLGSGFAMCTQSEFISHKKSSPMASWNASS